MTVSLPGDYGKPRPALIVQTDHLNRIHPSILVCPITSDIVDAPDVRLRLAATAESGLKVLSEIMIDKVTAVARHRVGRRIGTLDRASLRKVETILMFMFGIGQS